MQEIPQYKLDEAYLPVHRVEGHPGKFGYNGLDPSLRIKGFELYSSEGLARHIGPLRSGFYRIGLTIRGSCDVQLGLEHFVHRAGTVNCTHPNQLFSKTNISDDLFGYYLLFDAGFLDVLVADSRIADEFAFFSYDGTPFFQLQPAETEQVQGLIFRINDELQAAKPDREKAIQLTLYLILLELKRSYTSQAVCAASVPETATLTIKFRRLVNRHYLERQLVTDYAEMLFVTPNHLNRTVREVTGRTASSHIDEMILQEAKVLLLHTDLTVAAVSDRLRFSESSSFNRWFKKAAGLTPVGFRENAGSGQ